MAGIAILVITAAAGKPKPDTAARPPAVETTDTDTGASPTDSGEEPLPTVAVGEGESRWLDPERGDPADIVATACRQGSADPVGRVEHHILCVGAEDDLGTTAAQCTEVLGWPDDGDCS